MSGLPASFDDKREQIVFEIATCLANSRWVSKGLWDRAVEALGHEVTDHGCHDETPVDFPDISREVCTAVTSGKADRAILVCGTGVGASIAANKMPGIRASICHDGHTAHQCVEHDDVNVIMLVSNPSFECKTIYGPVQTLQVAPTVLKALGLDPDALDAVRIESTPVLPGLDLGD